MIYREFLVMRKAVLWYLAVIAGLAVVAWFIMMTQTHRGDNNVGVALLANPAAWTVSAFAAIFGVALGNASREGARVVWVLPTDRWKTALSVLGVDAIGVALAFAGTLAISFLFFFALMPFQPVVLHGSIDWGVTVRCLAFVYAIYGWSAAFGMIGRRVAYCGIASYPFLLVWFMFAHAAGTFGAMLRAPIAANPFAVITAASMMEQVQKLNESMRAQYDPLSTSLIWMGMNYELPVLLGTALVGCAVAVLLWQRAEVLNA